MFQIIYFDIYAEGWYDLRELGSRKILTFPTEEAAAKFVESGEGYKYDRVVWKAFRNGDYQIIHANNP